MSALPSQPEVLDELLIVLVDGELTPETFARLGSRLSEDPACAGRLSAIHAVVRCWSSSLPRGGSKRAFGRMQGLICRFLRRSSLILHPSSLFLSRWRRVVCIRVRRVDFCGWRDCRAGCGPGRRSEQLAQDADMAAIQPASKSSRLIVGKITAMSNCRWAVAGGYPCGEPVAQGRSYAMNAGLLEITYDMGAKVIVEGPAIYVADAHNGGVLLFGKMTAYVGKINRERLGAAKRP